ncbi:adenylate/guanylate cyclase domain-containing protein [Allocoleopsis sp.]|uniref:CHASE2 domain-containing protein n=1 Tax=Allocoleopsis sp. TaxID=3088169 RepID=UPI002FD3832A
MLTSLKKWLGKCRVVWITAPSIAGLIILMRVLGFLQLWEWAAFDQYMRLRPLEVRDNRIAIVGIDEADVKSIGQPILPDKVYAQLIEKLKARQPRAIGLDVFRDLPVEPGHEQLVRVFKSTPNLVGIEKVIGEPGRERVAPPPALKAKGQVGANDLIVDADSKVRRGLISVDTSPRETVYSFSLYLALLYLEAEGITPKAETQNSNVKHQKESLIWRLGKAVFQRFESDDGGYVRSDNRGYQVLINYRGGARTFETVSMRDVLDGKLPPEWGRDHVILIGFVGESFQDFFYTPYSNRLLSISHPTPGVEVHANLTSQIISAALDGRPLIKSWSEPVEWLWILLWSGIGAALTWQLRYTKTVSKISFRRRVGQVLVTVLLLGTTYIAFLGGWWIPVVPSFIALVGSSITITASVANSTFILRKTFGRYLSDEVVANLLESKEGLKLGGKRQKITILTSDLRGFTALSEQLPPEEVVTILNIYLKSMLDAIAAHHGTVDKFMGDGIMVLFGAPTVRDDDAKRAVACAVAMQLAMSDVNNQMQQLGFPLLEMGIGINTGEAVVGNIGSEKHSEYTAIGNEINLAFRLETYTTASQILISESTLQEVGESTLSINSHKQVQPKGVKQPITIYEVRGIRDPYNLFLPEEEDIFLLIAEEIPILYSVLDGKKVAETQFQGRIIKLSPKGAEITAINHEEGAIPSPLSNIKLNLLETDQTEYISDDIYAKVLEKAGKLDNFYIHFTFKPPTLTQRLSQARTRSHR